jgi:ATP-dependent exoDNAse (exonuclease V) beta subunit
VKRWTLVRAAAGTGKTTRLVQEYLRLLTLGCDASKVVAITFTRKAAGELIERVSDVLWAVLATDHGDGRAAGQAAVARLGHDLGLYRDCAPKDRDTIERALASLGDAPVGTIDSFVHSLLTEYVLDAALPLPDGGSVPLDLPVPTGGDPAPALEEAARQVLIEWGDADDLRLRRLTRHLSLGDLREAAIVPPAGAPPSTLRATFEALASEFVAGLEPSRLGGGLRSALLEAFGLREPRALWETQVAARLGSTVSEVTPLVAWLEAGGPPPQALTDLWPELSTAKPSVVVDRWPTGAGEALVRALAADRAEARAILVAAAGLKDGAEGWSDALVKALKKGGHPYTEEAAEWLAVGGSPAPDALVRAFSALKSRPKNPHAQAVAAAVPDLRFPPSTLAEHLTRDGVPAHDRLACDLGLTVLSGSWGSVLNKLVTIEQKALAPALAEWLGADEPTPPAELIPFLAGLGKPGDKLAKARLLGTDPEDKAPPPWSIPLLVLASGAAVRLRVEDLGKVMVRPFSDPAAWPIADALRADLNELRGAVRSRGLTLAAEQGRLGYGELLDAAVALVQSTEASHPIATRYQALLVDEAQDSSPTQIDLYQALVAANPDLRAVAVGDSRQSIYAFRGAEPHGLERLASGAANDERLLQNWRSTPELVAAQRAMFGPALGGALNKAGLATLESLVDLEAGREPRVGTPAPPVCIVTPVGGVDEDGEPLDPKKIEVGELEQRALERFAEQLRDRWQAGHAESAAVLAPTWQRAGEAADLLRGWLGQDEEGRERAWLDSGGEWVKGRVVKDLRILLSALLDRTDSLAWVGVWKHPMVGLSDRALALARRGHGLRGRGEEAPPPWLGDPGWLLDAEALEDPHDPRDAAAFERAQRPLRQAIRDLRRRGAAVAIERLAGALRWRELLAAGPHDDALAHLEVALDWLRDLESEGRSVPDLIEVLADTEAAQAPKLALGRPSPHVACMTVYSGKGLQWDHVLVLRPATQPGGSHADPAVLDVEVGDARLALVPVSLDPAGALAPETDPISKLAALVGTRRKLEEAIRLAYVGVTRAKLSVTLALPAKGSDDAVKALVEAWSPPTPTDGDPSVESASSSMDGVTWESFHPARLPQPPPPREVIASGSPLSASPPPDRAWVQQAPSSLDRGLRPQARLDLARNIAGAVLSAGTLARGLDGFLEPPASLEDDKRGQGDIAHAWMASWGLRGTPTRAQATAYLAQVWDRDGAGIIDWLLALSSRVEADPDHRLLRRVRKPGVERFFEWPILGESRLGDPTEPWLLAGSADLVLRDPSEPPERRWTVLDFKAGGKHPGMGGSDPWTVDSLVTEASLRSYGPQLEGYRSALASALQTRPAWRGEGVGAVGLWFVRKGAALWWEEV